MTITKTTARAESFFLYDKDGHYRGTYVGTMEDLMAYCNEHDLTWSLAR